MTPKADLPTDVNYRNLGVACRLADKAGATTCLITGKGEPTLYPDLITKYISNVAKTFPFIELQTNGMEIKELSCSKPAGMQSYLTYLEEWYRLGLTTVCLSAVGTDIANKKIYGADYPALEETIKILHAVGFSVRLSMMMLKGYICKPDDIDRVVDFCKKHGVEQLTLRPIAFPDDANSPTMEWTREHALGTSELEAIQHEVHFNGNEVLKLSHGATVYDYKGQNLCLSNCLTTNDTDENMRQIIYYPDGKISYDWKYEGARLL